jgi:putative endonuclease
MRRSSSSVLRRHPERSEGPPHFAVSDWRIHLNSEYACVYILANSFRKLYIGVTADLTIRMSEHKHKRNPKCHAARYGIDKLVYYERFTSIAAAIKRENVLKGWLRIRKLKLIIESNPLWQDLSADWGKPLKPFDLSREKDLTRPPKTFAEPKKSK